MNIHFKCSFYEQDLLDCHKSSLKLIMSNWLNIHSYFPDKSFFFCLLKFLDDFVTIPNTFIVKLGFKNIKIMSSSDMIEESFNHCRDSFWIGCHFDKLFYHVELKCACTSRSVFRTWKLVWYALFGKKVLVWIICNYCKKT